MKQQQVNLYLALPQPEQVHLSAKQILLATVVFFVLLCALTGLGHVQLKQKKRMLASMKQEQQKLQSQLITLAAKKTQLESQDDLKLHVDNLKDELLQKNRLHQGLSQIHHNNTQGFSPYLLALAKQSVTGIWLREIEILEAGEDIQLTGSALHASDVTLYLNKLSLTKAFTGKRFLVVDISKAEDVEDQVTFFASTKQRDKDE